MKHLTYIIAALLLFAWGCKKDNSPVQIDVGTIEYINENDYPFYAFLDTASLGIIAAHTTYKNTQVPIGKHYMNVVQASGFTVGPIKREGVATLAKSGIIQFYF